MAVLYLLCGIQGSGKTTFARNKKAELKAEIVSTDIIRSKYAPIDEKEVFPRAYKETAEYLSKGINVIFDATNITVGSRSNARNKIRALFDIPFDTICVVVKANVEICKNRVAKRNNMKGELFLPVDVVDNYHSRFEEPTLDEGFSQIITIINE